MTKNCEYNNCKLQAKYSNFDDIYPKYCKEHFLLEYLKKSNYYCNNCYEWLIHGICYKCFFAQSKL